MISSAVIKCIRTGYLYDSDGRRFVFLRLLFHVLNNGAFQKLIFSNEEDEVEDLTGDDEEKQMGDADDGSQPSVADDDSQKGVDEDDVEETAIPKKKPAGRKLNQTSTQSHLKQALKSIVPFGDFNFSGPASNTRNGGQSTPAVPKGAAAKTTKKPEKNNEEGEKLCSWSQSENACVAEGKIVFK